MLINILLENFAVRFLGSHRSCDQKRYVGPGNETHTGFQRALPINTHHERVAPLPREKLFFDFVPIIGVSCPRPGQREKNQMLEPVQFPYVLDVAYRSLIARIDERAVPTWHDHTGGVVTVPINWLAERDLV